MAGISRRRFVTGGAAAAGGALLAPVARNLASLQAASALPKRRFGTTDVELTVVGLGGGSRFYLPSPDDEHGAELVRQAIDRGMGVVETSANYGNGDSERRIGLAMKTHRSKVFLETKVDARDYDGAMRELERSLSRLQTDRLDLVLHHFLTGPDQIQRVLAPDGAERAIRKMVDQKVVRFRGFSCHLPALAREGIERLEPQAIQLPINATRVPDFEPDTLPLAKSRGVAVIAMKTSGVGYFLRENHTKPDRIDRYGPPPGALDHPDLPTARDYLSYALSLPLTTVVVGIDCLQTLDSVIANASAFRPLPAAELASISRRAQVFATTGFWIPGATPRSPSPPRESGDED
jgi:uncharacterized protein